MNVEPVSLKPRLSSCLILSWKLERQRFEVLDEERYQFLIIHAIFNIVQYIYISNYVSYKMTKFINLSQYWIYGILNNQGLAKNRLHPQTSMADISVNIVETDFRFPRSMYLHGRVMCAGFEENRRGQGSKCA